MKIFSEYMRVVNLSLGANILFIMQKILRSYINKSNLCFKLNLADKHYK